jgi:Flp pilus assembly protein CpaB
MTMDAQSAAVVAAIAAAISAFSALVGLLVALAALRMQSQAGKPRVRVVVKATMLASGPRLGAPFVDVTAQNRGPVPVTITSVGFDLAAKGSTAPIFDPHTITGGRALPRPLQPGEAVSIVFDFLELARLDASNHVRGAFVDTAAGDRYTGRVKRGFIRSWARHAAEWDHDR